MQYKLEFETPVTELNPFYKPNDTKRSMVLKQLKKNRDRLNTQAESISTDVHGNWTNKRAQEAERRRHKKDELLKLVACYNALIKDWEHDKVLLEMHKIRSKNDIISIRDGYYAVHDPEDLEWLVERKKTIIKSRERLGIDTEAKFNLVQELLKEYSIVNLSEKEKKERELKNRLDDLKRKKYPGFFPTPDKLINRMLDYAAMFEPGIINVLEPSAGIGSITERILTEYPEYNTYSCEIIPDLCEIMELKGIPNIMNIDIFSLKSKDIVGLYDRIIMNPPFEKGLDIMHIMHCWDLLAPHGKLVSVASAGVLSNTQKKFVEFREFVNEHGMFVRLEEGQFKNAFNSTNINVCLVTLNKDG